MRSRGPVWAQRGHLAGGRTATVLCHGSRSTSCEGRHVLPWMHGATDKCARRARSRSARGLQNTAREFVEKSKIESCLKQRATCTVDRPGQRKKKKKAISIAWVNGSRAWPSLTYMRTAAETEESLAERCNTCVRASVHGACMCLLERQRPSAASDLRMEWIENLGWRC